MLKERVWLDSSGIRSGKLYRGCGKRIQQTVKLQDGEPSFIEATHQ